MPALTPASLERAFEKVKKVSKRRNFTQSIELLVNLRGIDMKSPESRINEIVALPHSSGKVVKVCVIAEGDLISEAREAGADAVITKADLEKLAGDKKAAKKLVNSHDFFVARADLMPLVGRILGPILGPRGKMPEPVPPTADIKPIIERLRKAVRIRTKDQPVVKCRIGLETMDNFKLAENALAVLSAIEKRFSLNQHLDSIVVKATMGPPVEVEGL